MSHYKTELDRQQWVDENAKLREINAEVLAALKAFADEAQREGAFPHEVAEARKAIAKAEAI